MVLLWCRVPLGVPAQLILSAMDLAARLIGFPQSHASAGQAAEREAGYVMLGALMLALPAASVAAQRVELLELWRVALAPDVAADLDVKKLTQVLLPHKNWHVWLDSWATTEPFPCLRVSSWLGSRPSTLA